MPHSQMTEKQNLRVVILAGGCDFGRCPVASRLPTALWPVLRKPALGLVLQYLSAQGVKDATVCCNGDAFLFRNYLDTTGGLEPVLLCEPLPVGTAGCIRDAVRDQQGGLILVMSAQTVRPPEVDKLLEAHSKGGADLTVFFNPAKRDADQMGPPAGIFVCAASIVEHIPEHGYCDIKEELIPQLLSAGKTVHAAVLKHSVGDFANRQTYLEAMAHCLENARRIDEGLELYKNNSSQVIWKGENVHIGRRVRFYGPIVLMNGARVCEDAVLFGPVVLGENVTVGKGTAILNSALWRGSQTGSNCRVERCLVDYECVVPANSVVEDTAVSFTRPWTPENLVNRAAAAVKSGAITMSESLKSRLNAIIEKLPFGRRLHSKNVADWFAIGLVLSALIWSYRSGFADLWNVWRRSDE